jgi:hypothetical protein
MLDFIFAWSAPEEFPCTPCAEGGMIKKTSLFPLLMLSTWPVSPPSGSVAHCAMGRI